MRPTRTADERIEDLLRPVMPAEGIATWFLGEALLRELAPGDPRRDLVRWRTLELRVRHDPLGALARLDAERAAGEPADADRLRAEAALATGDVARARALLAAHRAQDGAPWRLARALLALAEGDAARGIAEATAAVEAAPDDEWRVLARAWRAEAHARAGRPADGEADRAAVRAIAERHGPASAAALDLHLALAATPRGDDVRARWWGHEADAAIAALCEGLAEADAALGGVPRHVHAAFRRHLAAPEQLEGALIGIAGLLHRAGRRRDAYATFRYGAAIAARLVPARAARLAEALAAYEEVVGPAEAAALRAEVDAGAPRGPAGGA